MRVFLSPAQRAHAGDSFLVNGTLRPIPEQPTRIDHLLRAVSNLGLTPEAPPDSGDAPLARVHTAEYLHFLRTIWTRWQRLPGASAAVRPNVFPDRRDGAYPRAAVGQAGYHLGDYACPVLRETWTTVRASAHGAVAAARAVHDGERVAYALCRPPGHHAGPDLAGGFCYLNNSAIAAADLTAAGRRVAVLDVDLHHGNGTQAIFYDRADVLTVSVHADPADFYPFFWGHAAERGRGPGLGFNLNLPLPLGTGDAAWLETVETALARIDAFAPDVLVVALGLDASAEDPFGGLAITPDGFARVGALLGAFGRPLVLVQEGGYVSPVLAENLEQVVGGVLGAR
ncbi:histone deacetylase family protein [Roseospira goensis]|uniref:Acetoin utilization deacetylase AcuC-like enzyme n=1 Tax=Roseospira goensis TaxID=391922 RepID=A0A7W6S1S5_9PROT|nr:histone deacetylase family protein [Roseospira goensis]MBB4287330.1 acetoin utilization deacetylase AcuC-like enzyme [Roseospira goensis]